MLNSGFRGKRATDGTGAISVQTQSVQATFPVPKINGWAVTDGNYVAIDDTAATSGSTIVIYGNNFVTGMTVYINNSSVAVTYLDSTRITFTAPTLGNGTYVIYIITPQGGAAILAPGIIYSGFPTWSTISYNTTSTTLNIQLVVSGDAPLTYSLQAGSTLPTGITLTSTGLLTGTATSVTADSVFYFTVIVDDAQLQSTQQLITLSIQFGDPYFNYTSLLLNGETSVTSFIKDESANNFALTIAGDTKPTLFNPYTPGYYSNYFDGTGDYLTVASNAAFQLGTDSYTFETWIYPTALGSNNTNNIFNIGTYITGIMIRGAATTGIEIYTNNTQRLLTATGLTQNAWQHIALVRNVSACTFYVNGASIGTFTDSSSISPATATVTIGMAAHNSSEFFTGYMSNYRLVKGTAVYTSAFTPSTTPLTAVSGTSLLTCQSNRLIDNSTNTFTITKNGDTLVSPVQPFTANSSYSTYGSAYFDGTGDVITVPGSAALSTTGDFTYEFWIFLTSLSTTAYIFDNYVSSATGAGNTQLTVNGSGRLNWYYDGATLLTSVNGDIVVGVWTHIAAVRSGQTLKIYINGVATANTATFSGTVGTASATFGIGGKADASSNLLFGYISNFRYAKTAVYMANFTPSSTPLTAIANTSLLTLQYNGGANNSGIIDNGLFRNVVTRFGNTSQGSFSPYSVTGWSNYFDGSGDALDTATTTTNFVFGNTTNFTIEAWVYPLGYNQSGSGPPDRAAIWSCATAEGGNPRPQFSLNTTGKIVFGGWNNMAVTGATTVPLNKWSHVAVTFDGTTYRVFYNGTLDGTGTSIFNFTTTPLTGTVGANPDGTYRFPYLGYISNVRVLRGTALYTATFTPPTSPLTAITNTVFLTCQSNRFIDNSSNNFALTKAGDVSVQAFSPFGSIREAVPLSYSNYFDGNGDYLSIPYTTSISQTSPYTLEFWFYPTYNYTGQYIFGQNGGGAFNLAWTGTVIKVDKQGVGIQITGTTTLALNQWHHYAMTYDGTTTRVFANGALDGSVAGTGGLANVPTTIGYYEAVGSSSYGGYISNFRFVTGSALYTSAFTPSTTPLTAISGTSLLTCQSTTLIDSSTNRFTLTVNGDTKPVKFNPFGYTTQSATSYTPSLHGGSIYLDGTGDYVNIATSTIFGFGNGDFTIDFWAYPTVNARQDWVDITDGSGRVLVYYSGSAITFYSIPTNTAAITGPAMVLNQWYHIALSKSSGSSRLFVNGVQVGSTYASNQTYFTTSAVTIGKDSAGSTHVTGYMSDVRIIKGIGVYTSNFLPPTQALTNYSTTYPSSLLLNFNNGGIVDQHSSVVLETLGNVQLSTAIKKYGTASMYFDGTGDYLTIPTNPGFVFGTGDFTIEAWFYIVSGAVGAIFDTRSGATGVTPLLFFSSSQLRYYVNGADLILSGTTLSTATWYHVALVRSSGSSKMYLNGAQTGSTAVDTNNFILTNTINIGRGNDNANVLNGYIDELRITKGFARYTANFTAPASTFVGQ